MSAVQVVVPLLVSLKYAWLRLLTWGSEYMKLPAAVPLVAVGYSGNVQDELLLPSSTLVAVPPERLSHARVSEIGVVPVPLLLVKDVAAVPVPVVVRVPVAKLKVPDAVVPPVPPVTVKIAELLPRVMPVNGTLPTLAVEARVAISLAGALASLWLWTIVPTAVTSRQRDRTIIKAAKIRFEFMERIPWIAWIVD